MAQLALHSAKDAEHYTPGYLVDAARRVLGDIDLDPASNQRANETVDAGRFYGALDVGQSRIWGGRVYCNPPGDKAGKLVKAFWRRATEHALYGGPGSAVLWAGFNVQQLGSLQKCQDVRGVSCAGPLGWWPTVAVADRIKWTRGRQEVQLGLLGADYNEVISKNGSPAHNNFFCLLGGDRAMRGRFHRTFKQYGDYAPGRIACTW